MLRVFLSAGYKAPREMTWLTGLAAFLLILGFSLSGYLLPWDQKGVLGDDRDDQRRS